MAIIVKYTVMTSVIFLMLAVGLRTPFSQVRQVVRNRSLLMRGLAANFVVAPLLMYVSMYWLPVAAEVKMGIMLMAAAPIAPMAPLPFVGIAKGDLAYSAGLMVVAAVLSVALTPLIIALSFPSSAEGGVAVDPMQIVQTLFTVQLLPMGVGMMLQHYSPTWNKRLLSFVPMLGQVGLLVGIVLLLASQAREIMAIGTLGFLINIALVILLSCDRRSRFDQRIRGASPGARRVDGGPQHSAGIRDRKCILSGYVGRPCDPRVRDVLNAPLGRIREDHAAERAGSITRLDRP